MSAVTPFAMCTVVGVAEFGRGLGIGGLHG
jgi:hypothetical protein